VNKSKLEITVKDYVLGHCNQLDIAAHFNQHINQDVGKSDTESQGSRELYSEELGGQFRTPILSVLWIPIIAYQPI
jgi:hypothetical protein